MTARSRVLHSETRAATPRRFAITTLRAMPMHALPDESRNPSRRIAPNDVDGLLELVGEAIRGQRRYHLWKLESLLREPPAA